MAEVPKCEIEITWTNPRGAVVALRVAALAAVERGERVKWVDEDGDLTTATPESPPDTWKICNRRYEDYRSGRLVRSLVDRAEIAWPASATGAE